MKQLRRRRMHLKGLLNCVVKVCGLIILALSLTHCSQINTRASLPDNTVNNQHANIEIAFLADVHLHDIYAAPDGSSDSVNRFPLNAETRAPLLMRSMQAQLTSTRLFNENYFVFRAALDAIAKRGIKLVALPGDFSDDGQPANVTALTAILNEYHTRFGMRFFAITGNHDPVRPFSRAGGKPDFLTADGKEAAIYSPDHTRCSHNSTWFCLDSIREWGYRDIMKTLSGHGFSVHSQDLMYETPFNSTEFENRGWQWCDGGSCIFMPDASYLVEPIEGVWLLAIDANVYIPKGNYADLNFSGSGNAGYNALLTYKPQLLTWITDVVARAKKANKRLIAFSHFPMADFYDDTQLQLENLFGKTSNQLKRMPLSTTTEALNATGLKLHMAGHMHLYDVALPKTHQGLVNVQVPSLAAYQPGYSVVTLMPQKEAKIQTIIQRNVANFTRLFPHYVKEWQHRQRTGQALWNKDILTSPSYLAFTEHHLKEVVRQRYVGKEWPTTLATYFQTHNINETLNSIVCAHIWEDIPDDIASLPAMVLAYDYYKLRNAGPFADLEGREKWYKKFAFENLSTQCEVTDDHELKTSLLGFIHLLGKAALAKDRENFVIQGV